MRKRREIVRQNRAEPEVLRAPVDGVIASARVVAGQVVQAQDALFQIVDPKGLWVEALVYAEVDPARIAGASALAVDGTPLTLVLPGLQPDAAAAGDGRAVRGREPARRHQRRPAGDGRRARTAPP